MGQRLDAMVDLARRATLVVPGRRNRWERILAATPPFPPTAGRANRAGRTSLQHGSMQRRQTRRTPLPSHTSPRPRPINSLATTSTYPPSTHTYVRPACPRSFLHPRSHARTLQRQTTDNFKDRGGRGGRDPDQCNLTMQATSSHHYNGHHISAPWIH